MARTLHISWLLSTAMFCACIVPPHAEPTEGVNHPPVINAPKSGTARTVFQTATQPYDDTEFQVEITDPNLNQDLFLRFFVNFGYESVVPSDTIKIPAEAASPRGERIRRVRITGLCDTVLDSLGDHILELYVSDHDFVGTTGKEVPDEGRRDSVTLSITCESPLPPSGDGGV